MKQNSIVIFETKMKLARTKIRFLGHEILL